MLGAYKELPHVHVYFVIETKISTIIKNFNR